MRLVQTLEDVLEAKAGASHVRDAGVDPQLVVEAARGEIAHVRLDRQGLDALLDQTAVAARKARQIGDARDLEPVEVDGVVRDPLRVRLAEADTQIDREVVALHGPGTFSAFEVSEQLSPRRKR